MIWLKLYQHIDVTFRGKGMANTDPKNESFRMWRLRQKSAIASGCISNPSLAMNYPQKSPDDRLFDHNTVLPVLLTRIHQPRPVLQRLRQMGSLDRFAARQVGDGARQLEHAVVGARREVAAGSWRSSSGLRLVSSRVQNWRTSAGRMSALQVMAF